MSRPKMTQAEAAERYRDYRRGWASGASGQTTLSQVGTQEPTWREEFDRGFEGGRSAFESAMKGRFASLKEAVGGR